MRVFGFEKVVGVGTANALRVAHPSPCPSPTGGEGTMMAKAVVVATSRQDGRPIFERGSSASLRRSGFPSSERRPTALFRSFHP
ncbi:hypothetical protein A6302_02725 [Methylobrevis pamukkalensis]|uniref:Uncharacterized protein n=1 Tax=Methylobrevis pamukkalensis TaxID=1439726 RepID=A0A1E3H0Y5_9HYPH|nr:hypothetical protein A6302_02725 [Methylobrevis pamukkalensis]